MTPSKRSEPAQAQLVVAMGGRLVTDSRTVARAFGKLHKNVLRTIDDMLASENLEIREHARLNFEPMTLQSKAGKGALRSVRAYRIARDGFSELAMSFTGDKARIVRIRFLAAFNEMADRLKRGQQGLWTQLLDNLKRDKESREQASVGSKMLLTRKRELGPLREERAKLELAIQPTLLN
ncbi:Rha family transcriptional regulator [Massilia sp. TS11]|uniref:Rha family transcriptional regulator n=1 Tax=Massilia sp. TS11 TaxID=2908003 RepID=UPI001EDC71BB|nr:Rha family transcriptional regulator [Massilia sp. TS11]MCG2586486.1 Rha family transcriptional regulator [Massilia sp. TS11]